MKTLIPLLCLLPMMAWAQEKPYFYEIPPAPEAYTGTGIATRMVDGLGFRYFWATDGLREEDMSYKPSEEGRTTYETLVHIHGLTEILYRAVRNEPMDFGLEKDSLSLTQLREQTLGFIEAASKKLRQSQDTDLATYTMIFVNGDRRTDYPFWNLINGPIEDAVWHVGQIVTFRRSSGNPMNSRAGMLQGKVME